jgi:peptidoglycan/LPS O-acetylase OafA/YrhL
MLKKLTGPGLFRLFLALVVFVHHNTRLHVGNSAVYVFFCLSGFWIYKMYLGRYSATRQRYLTYIVSRAWRLMPTFWLVSMLTLFFLYIEGSLAVYLNGPNRIHLIISSLFIFGYDSLSLRPVGPAWSLDVEAQFYLIAPFIAVFIVRRKAWAGWFLLAIAFVSLASALMQVKLSLLRYLVFFVMGMTAAAAGWRPSWKVALAFLATAAGLILLCVASPWRGILMGGAHPGAFSMYGPHANVMLGILGAPYAIYTTRQKGFSADGMFADLSYIVYMLHWAAAIWLGSQRGDMAHKLASLAVAWIAVIGLSFVIWKVYDHPINRMRSRWVSGRKKTVTMALNPAASAEAGTGAFLVKQQ